MSDIDWGKSPKGTEYSYKDDWYKVVNNILFRYEPKCLHSSFSGYHWARSEYIEQLTEKMTGRPVKPVYTQSMVDKGESPLVGMEYIDGGGILCKCLVSYGGQCIGLQIERVVPGLALPLSQTARGYCKVIDTRTDSEKAIDNMLKDMSIAFELRSDHEDYLVNDDTQIGVEFAIEYMRNHGISFKGDE